MTGSAEEQAMLDRLTEIEARFQEITERMADPDVIADISGYQQLAKEHRRLSALVETGKNHQRAEYQGRLPRRGGLSDPSCQSSGV